MLRSLHLIHRNDPVVDKTRQSCWQTGWRASTLARVPSQDSILHPSLLCILAAQAEEEGQNCFLCMTYRLSRIRVSEILGKSVQVSLKEFTSYKGRIFPLNIICNSLSFPPLSLCCFLRF